MLINVINLERRKERREIFSDFNDMVAINFVPAIDGKTLNIPQLVRDSQISPDLHHHSNGTIGCALTHKLLWEKVVNENEQMIICEDDAVLRRDFSEQYTQAVEQLPTDWDILLLGWNFDSILDVEIIPGIERALCCFTNIPLDTTRLNSFQTENGKISTLPLRNAFGVLCYAISPKGAKILLEKCFPLHNETFHVPALGRQLTTFTLDCLMNSYYQSMQSFVAFPPIAVSPNDKSTSDCTT